MKQLTRATRLLFYMMVAMATVFGAGVGQVGAQKATTAGDSYVSELSDIEVVASGDFTITDSQLENYDQGDGELVYLESDDALLQVSFFDDTDDPDTTVELFNQGFASEMDDFEVLDEGLEGDIVWSFSSATLDGAELYHYLSVTPDVVGNVDVMTVIVAPTDLFFDSVEAAQQDVTLDGDGIFAEIDLDALEAAASGSVTPTIGKTGSSATATSAGNVTVSEVTGLDVEVNEPWVVTKSQVFDDTPDKEEALTIQSDAANGNIGFFVGDDAEVSMNAFLDGFSTSAQERQTVDTDYRRGVAWSLDNAVLGDGTSVVMYTEVREGMAPGYLVLVAILAEPENFADEFTSAQDSLSIDGEPVFQDVDIADLEELLGNGPADEVDATAQPGAGTTTDIRRENAKLPGNDSASDLEKGNETETGNGGQKTGPIDFEAAGLISDNAYTSPQFDIDVEWGDTWLINHEDEDSVKTDPAGEVDSLFLVWGGDDFALMFLDFSTAEGLTPEDFVTYWTSDDYLAENAAPNAEVLLDKSRQGNGAVLTRDYLDSGDEVLILKEAILLDDGETLALVTLIAGPDMYAEIYADAESDVEIAGGPALTTFTTRQVERAIDQ